MILIRKYLVYLHSQKLRVLSSAGLEYRLDRAGVAGSNPAEPTKEVFF